MGTLYPLQLPATQKSVQLKAPGINSCKKGKLKAGDTDIEVCLGSGTSGIPDGKAKVSKKCGNGLGGTVGKKCGVPNTDALLPPCAGQNLGDCLDRKIECEVCLALNALDGLNQDCDEFDDGVVNGSCPKGQQKRPVIPRMAGRCLILGARLAALRIGLATDVPETAN